MAVADSAARAKPVASAKEPPKPAVGKDGGVNSSLDGGATKTSPPKYRVQGGSGFKAVVGFRV